MSNVYIFWDNSNIFISAKHVADMKDGFADSQAVRIQFDNIWKLAHAGRKVAKGVAVGSVPPENEDVWNKFRSRTGVSLELYEVGKNSNKEQGVDQCLQTHMLRALADEAEPQIAVLLTGDGKGQDGVGFFHDMKRLYERGWGVEVVAWDISCHRALKEWAENEGVFVRLEDYYPSVTFISGGRQSSPLSLVNRKCSRPQLKLDPELVALRKKVEEYEQQTLKKKAYGQKVNARKKKS